MSNKIAKLRQNAFTRQSGHCYYCNVQMWLVQPTELPTALGRDAYRLRCTAEHLIAQQDGGKDVQENIAAACFHCNQTRHKRRTPPEPDQFRAQIQQRVSKGKWHQPQVFAAGLLSRLALPKPKRTAHGCQMIE